MERWESGIAVEHQPPLAEDRRDDGSFMQLPEMLSQLEFGVAGWLAGLLYEHSTFELIILFIA